MALRRCNRCGAIVFRSNLPEEYSYQCFNCDEDMYMFETHENKINIEDALLEELYSYVKKEYDEEILTKSEQQRYIKIVDILKTKGVEIPFGIEI